MPRTKRPKPLYQRGDFRLYRRKDRENLEIIFYDPRVGRERSASAGTSDDAAARLEVDRRYLAATGQRFCHACGRPFEGEGSPLLSVAIKDYLLLSMDKKGYASIRTRLALVGEYLKEVGSETTCAEITPQWVDNFRKWLAPRRVFSMNGKDLRERSLGHVEGCVRQLAACINATHGQKAQFAAEQPKAVAQSPKYRADVKTLAAMFRFCLYPEAKPKEEQLSDKEVALRLNERANLLRYLRAAVATWARPEEIFDLGKGQWTPSARVLDLNPPGRRQTRKYRTTIPVARQFAPHLDFTGDRYMPVNLIRNPWEKMRAFIGLPDAHGEAGPKLIRRSMATLVRKRIGEANWRQGELMLGHQKTNISDIYAIPDPANLGLALAATEEIIDEIEALCPGAYNTAHRNFTALRVVA